MVFVAALPMQPICCLKQDVFRPEVYVSVRRWQVSVGKYMFLVGDDMLLFESICFCPGFLFGVPARKYLFLSRNDMFLFDCIRFCWEFQFIRLANIL